METSVLLIPQREGYKNKVKTLTKYWLLPDKVSRPKACSHFVKKGDKPGSERR